MNDEEENQDREKRKRSRPKQKSSHYSRFGVINLHKYFSYEVIYICIIVKYKSNFV